MTQEQVLAQTVAASVGLGPVGVAIGAAAGLAQAVATVDAVMAELERASDDLKAAGMAEVGVNDFGASWAGTNLGTHAQKAQQNVIQQLDQLSAGLAQYKEDLIASAKDWQDTDDTVAQPFVAINSMTSCVAEDFTSDSGRNLDNQCLPGEDR
ncbi:hypothetical protein [Nocardioides solisilvae]|uniref:hypothetical protein n=1 Tax=Nocardioides solisilvae TaxID=1542435 RepID=UPI000D746210|nr:hypothetical protein [Nocardioides solisilvae]